PGGPAMANQVTERNPGRNSATGGASGTTADRSVLPTAMILTLPALCCGTEVVTVSKNMSTSPPMTALSAGTAPGNGTCAYSTPSRSSIWIAERCAVDPAPFDANVSLPGLAAA